MNLSQRDLKNKKRLNRSSQLRKRRAQILQMRIKKLFKRWTMKIQLKIKNRRRLKLSKKMSQSLMKIQLKIKMRWKMSQSLKLSKI